MKIIVERLFGDATVNIKNKNGEIVHIENFSGNIKTCHYERSVPVPIEEFGGSFAVFSGVFEYRMVA